MARSHLVVAVVMMMGSFRSMLHVESSNAGQGYALENAELTLFSSLLEVMYVQYLGKASLGKGSKRK